MDKEEDKDKDGGKGRLRLHCFISAQSSIISYKINELIQTL